MPGSLRLYLNWVATNIWFYNNSVQTDVFEHRRIFSCFIGIVQTHCIVVSNVVK